MHLSLIARLVVRTISVTTMLVCLLVAAFATAAPDLKTIMQNPDWIGPPVESAWWQLDSDDYL